MDWRLKRHRRESGEVALRKSGHAAEPKWLAHRERLEQLLREQPDATLSELRERLGIDISVQTLSRALRALQLTFKKKSCVRRSKIALTFKSVALPGKPR